MKRTDSSSAGEPLAYHPKREDRQTCLITLHEAQFQEVDRYSRDNGVCACGYRCGAPRVYSCSHHISLERLRKQFAADSRSQAAVDAREQQDHQWYSIVG
jgi:hypothetical protein